MPDPGSPVSLSVSGLTLQRGAARLGPIRLTIPEAGCWWLNGVSGAGKSLLLEALAGFHGSARGSVLVAGQEVAELAPERRSIALMPQRWRLFPHWSVARNLRFAASLSRSAEQRVTSLVERLGIASLLHRPSRGLSGGETQRIALAQTLLSPAKVLLLDEPLSAIDTALQVVCLNLLQEEAATYRRIVLIAAHLPAASHPMQGAWCLAGGKLRD